MTDAWNMTGGQVYVAPVGADPKDPSRWHQLGMLTEMTYDLEPDEWSCGSRAGKQTYTLTTGGPVTLFTEPDPELLKLYWGKNAGIVNNRGEARKEEKHMGVRKFESVGGSTLSVGHASHKSAAWPTLIHTRSPLGTASGWFAKADVPLIAHALFEKSGWPDAVKDDDGEFVTAIGGQTSRRLVVGSEFQANYMLATAISALAAYNAWVEGAAARLEAEVAAEAARVEAEERRAAENARKREHDALRTSAIALEALELYNEHFEGNYNTPYASWVDANSGTGTSDETVRRYIRQAEAARAAKPAPKVGDRVRVSYPAKTVNGGKVFFGKEVEGLVVKRDGDPFFEGDIIVQATDEGVDRGNRQQYVDSKYVTVLATAEDLPAEKAKAERAAGIAAIRKVDPHIGRYTAEHLYDGGIRATA